MLFFAPTLYSIRVLLYPRWSTPSVSRSYGWHLWLFRALTIHLAYPDSVPKGGWEPEDVKLETAASREALEEGPTLCSFHRHLTSWWSSSHCSLHVNQMLALPPLHALCIPFYSANSWSTRNNHTICDYNTDPGDNVSFLRTRRCWSGTRLVRTPWTQARMGWLRRSSPKTRMEKRVGSRSQVIVTRQSIGTHSGTTEDVENFLQGFRVLMHLASFNRQCVVAFFIAGFTRFFFPLAFTGEEWISEIPPCEVNPCCLTLFDSPLIVQNKLANVTSAESSSIPTDLFSFPLLLYPRFLSKPAR